jgi:glycosyltransferase involved in cell wall biosynthesis
MLRRAIESVLAQTFVDWEMVISDDEPIPGETWRFLQTFAKSDGRVRPIKNGKPHGAHHNHNAVLKASRGEWIKLLHDDDVLKPNCLEVLAGIVKEREQVVAISFACEEFVDDKLISPFRRRDRALLEQIEPGDALLAMYVLDEACWALPSQQMVHRSVIDAGVLFEKAPGIVTLYDSWFNARVHSYGAALVYNSPLVEWHQGRHETTTSEITDDDLTAEFVAFRKLLLSLMPRRNDLPSLNSVENMVMLVRAFKRLAHAHPLAAMQGIAGIWDPAAYGMAIKWLLRQYYPRRFSSISRSVIWRDEREVASGAHCRSGVS